MKSMQDMVVVWICGKMYQNGAVTGTIAQASTTMTLLRRGLIHVDLQLENTRSIGAGICIVVAGNDVHTEVINVHSAL